VSPPFAAREIDKLQFRIAGKWHEMAVHYPPHCSAVTLTWGVHQAMSIRYECFADVDRKPEAETENPTGPAPTG